VFIIPGNYTFVEGLGRRGKEMQPAAPAAPKAGAKEQQPSAPPAAAKEQGAE
jgi:hypothetical protein